MEADLRHQGDVVLRAAVDLGVALLPAVATDLTDGHAGDANRLERDPENVKRGATYRISDIELASRLSFFLGKSAPDDTLLAAAAAGESTAPRRSTHHYETSRPFYQMGHVARHNPDYHGRSFSEVEPDLQRQWESGPGRQHGTWPEVRDYVGYSFESSADPARGSSEMHGEANIGNTHVSGSVNMHGNNDNTR